MKSIVLSLFFIVNSVNAASQILEGKQLEDQAAVVCGEHEMIDSGIDVMRNQGVIQSYKDVKNENPDMSDYIGLNEGGCIDSTIKKYNSNIQYYSKLKNNLTFLKFIGNTNLQHFNTYIVKITSKNHKPLSYIYYYKGE